MAGGRTGNHLPGERKGGLMKMAHTLRLALALAAVSTGVFAAGAPAAGPVAPETRFPPSITGTPGVGKTLTAGNGVWGNSPTKYAYQWLRCDEKGAACTSIS